MATSDEIRHRVEEADTVRCAQRAAAAQHVGELAFRRAVIAEQLKDIERELGGILAAATEVIGIDELARFTDVNAADLTRWLTAHKPVRAKRNKPASAPPETSREPSAPRTPQGGRNTTSPIPRDDVSPAPERSPAR